MKRTVAANTHLTRRLSQTFSLIIILFLSLVAFAWYNINVAGKAYLDTYESNQILSATQKVLLSVVDSETGARGYLLTGQDDFLDPYRKGTANFPEALTSLRQLTDHRSGDVETWNKVEAAFKEWHNKTLTVIKERSQAGSGIEALRASAAGATERRKSVDIIRRTIGEYDAKERAQLERREKDYQFFRWRNRVTLATATVFSVGLALGLGFLVLRATRSLSYASAKLAEANDELESSNQQLESINRTLADTNDRLNEEVNERKLAELKLAESVADLERSNADLEQFAYVASHDLQEPLRAVGGCAQLLKRRLDGQLDARCQELIGHTVDGALRMQTLINDLLTYSRVGTKGMPMGRVSLDEVLKSVTHSVATSIEESGAQVTHDPLPIVRADPGQIELVLQNLVSNAIKFHGPEVPKIHVGCQEKTEQGRREWLISVRDNGLGIEPQYFDRIFVMFQRLHTREEFEGTGIGLAVCKKIVDRHGGRIWVESQKGEGTTFIFTLPVQEEEKAATNNGAVN